MVDLPQALRLLLMIHLTHDPSLISAEHHDRDQVAPADRRLFAKRAPRRQVRLDALIGAHRERPADSAQPHLGSFRKIRGRLQCPRGSPHRTLQ
jgi:hypothetical protein